MQEPSPPLVLPLEGNSGDSVGATVAQIDAACQMVAAARRTARQLAVQASLFGLTESEFRLLWQLRTDFQDKSSAKQTCELLNQKALGERLGLSPAQVSTMVERLQGKGLIVGQPSAEDRRRRVWQLALNGKTVLEAIVARLDSQLGDERLAVSAYKEEAA